MGANQSGHTRTVTMENPTSVGVIDVSDAVVQRLRNTLSKSDATATKDKTSATAGGGDNVKSQTVTLQPATVPSTPSPGASIPSSYSNPGQYSPMALAQQHGGEPTITAIDVRRQKDAELAQNDVYWRRRMQQLEQTLSKTNTIMEKEYSAAVEDVRKRFQNAPATHQLPPCQDLKTQLIVCYRTNPGESLKCAEEVTAFTNCVSQNRINKLDEKSEQGKKAAAATK